MERWLRCVDQLTYKDVEVLMVDNSPNWDFYHRWKNKVPMVHLELPENTSSNRRIALSMEYIRKVFLEGNYEWWLNLESDVIVPPYTIEFMLPYAKAHDWVAMSYPNRNQKTWICGCFGCTLFSREIAKMSFEDAPDEECTDSWYEWKARDYKRYIFPMDVLKTEHLSA